MLEAQAKRLKRINFIRYVVALSRIGFVKSLFFWSYAVALLVGGPVFCNRVIALFLKVWGHTPNLGGSVGNEV